MWVHTNKLVIGLYRRFDVSDENLLAESGEDYTFLLVLLPGDYLFYYGHSELVVESVEELALA
jgi:hypothetical protein